MMSQADAVFVGRVAGVSPTIWNQDSGAYWEGGFQLHTLEFEVESLIADEVGLHDTAVLTIIGPSPLGGNADYLLSIGDRALVFVEQREFAWAGGRKPVLTLLGVPTDSYYRELDGLYTSVVRMNARSPSTS